MPAGYPGMDVLVREIFTQIGYAEWRRPVVQGYLIAREHFIDKIRDTIQLLALQPGERLLVPLLGTSLDLPLVPPGTRVMAGDISPEMLAQAQDKTGQMQVDTPSGWRYNRNN